MSESSAGLWKKISLPNFFSQKIFIYPTETFYALGCSAYCGKSIEKIYNLKQREKTKPLLVLVENWEMLKKYASITKFQLKSIENFFKLIGTGRCTVILKTKGLLSKKLNPEGEKIGFRITSHPLAKKLLRFAQVPLVATSANLSGQPAVTNWRKLSTSFQEKVDFILDGGDTFGGKPSSLLDLSFYPKISILREGKCSIRSLEEIIQKNQLPLQLV